MRIAIVGAGRVGTALGVLLGRAGHDVAAVAGGAATRERATTWLPGIPVLEPIEAARRGELVLLAVPDDRIGAVAAVLAGDGAVGPGIWVAHTSGARGLDVLAPVLDVGGRRLLLHPLQTFPDVERAIDTIPGCTVAITADDEGGFALGESLARDLRTSPFRLRDEVRPLYHAAAVFASNYLVAISGIAERLLREAGVPDPQAALRPLQAATLDNVGRLGAAEALTGPAVRGDFGTIARNLEALAATAPDTVPAYVALCRVALDLAEKAGRLMPAARAEVEEVLARWS